MIKVERLHNLSDIPPDKWNALLASSCTNEVFLTSEWINCWWDCLSNGRELLLLQALESNELVGIAPLMITRGIIEFIGTGESDYADFIIQRDKADETLQAFSTYLNTLKSWKRISLENIPQTSPTIAYLRQHKIKNTKLREYVAHTCPALKISGNEEFVKSCLNKSTLKKRFNQFTKRGDLTFNTLQNLNDILPEFPAFFEFHMDRRIIIGDESKFTSEKYRDFYKSIVKAFTQNEWMKFDVLKLNDEPLAHHFGFIYADKVYHYTTTINHNFAKRSPGLVHLKFTIEDCLEKNVKELDFIRGNESWKQSFSGTSSENLSFELFRNTLDWKLTNTLHNLKNAIHQKSPSLFEKLKSARQNGFLAKLVRKAGRAVKRHGIAGTTVLLMGMIFSKLFLSLNVYLYRKVLAERDDWTCGDFLIRVGRFSDLRKFIDENPYVEKKHFIKSGFERLQKGDKLFVVEKDNKLIHHSWATFEKRVYIVDIDDYFDFGEQSWWMYHSYTSENYRGLGIYTAVLRFVADTVADEGAKYLYGHVVLSNFIPHKGISKTGAVPIAYKKLTRILGINFRSSGIIEHNSKT